MPETILAVVIFVISVFFARQAMAARGQKQVPQKELAQSVAPFPPPQGAISSQLATGLIPWFRAEQLYRQHGIPNGGILGKIIQDQIPFDKLEAEGKLTASQEKVSLQMDSSKASICKKLEKTRGRGASPAYMDDYLTKLSARPEAIRWRLLSGNLTWSEAKIKGKLSPGGESLLRRKYSHPGPILNFAYGLETEITRIKNSRGTLTAAQQQLMDAIDDAIRRLQRESDEQYGGQG